MLLWSWLAGALAVYLLALGLLWRFQEWLIFPRAHMRGEPPAGGEAQEFVAADGAILRGWLRRLPAPAQGAALLVYFGGNNEEVSCYLRECPLVLSQLYVNYRGYGTSDGTPAATAMQQDALLVYDEILRREAVPGERVCLMGRSLGSHFAAYVAARRKVGGLVLVSPFDSVAAVARRRYPVFPVSSLLRHNLDTLADAAKISAPTLALLASQDRVVPLAHSRALLRRWRAPLRVCQLPNTNHNSIGGAPDYWQSVARFAKDMA